MRKPEKYFIKYFETRRCSQKIHNKMKSGWNPLCIRRYFGMMFNSNMKLLKIIKSGSPWALMVNFAENRLFRCCFHHNFHEIQTLKAFSKICFHSWFPIFQVKGLLFNLYFIWR